MVIAINFGSLLYFYLRGIHPRDHRQGVAGEGPGRSGHREALSENHSEFLCGPIITLELLNNCIDDGLQIRFVGWGDISMG